MTTFRELISKVIVDPIKNSELSKEILNWVKDVKPRVIVRKHNKGVDDGVDEG